MKAEDLIRKNLATARMMQIATVNDGQPWICTVYFVADEQQNLYWLSLPGRRHSREIAAHNRIAVAIPVKFDKLPVIGIQAEGVAELIQDGETVKRLIPDYVAKYGTGKDFYDNFMNGTAEHRLYKFTPARFSLFDEVNFPDDSPQEWRP